MIQFWVKMRCLKTFDSHKYYVTSKAKLDQVKSDSTKLNIDGKQQLKWWSIVGNNEQVIMEEWVIVASSSAAERSQFHKNVVQTWLTWLRNPNRFEFWLQFSQSCTHNTFLSSLFWQPHSLNLFSIMLGHLCFPSYNFSQKIRTL